MTKVGKTILVGIAYFGLWILFNRLAYLGIPPRSSAPMHPESGLAVAFILTFGIRWLPVVFLTSLLHSIFWGRYPAWIYQDVLRGIAYVISYGLVCHAMIQRTGIPVRLHNLLGQSYLLVIGFVGPLLWSLLSIWLIQLAGVPPSSIISFGFLAWSGEAAGVIIVAPVLIFLLLPLTRFFSAPPSQPKEESYRVSRQEVLEAILFGVIAVALFSVGIYAKKNNDIDLLFLSILPLLVAAARHGFDGAWISSLCANSMLIVGRGFWGWNAVQSPIDFRVLLISLSATSLVLGLFVSELRRVEASIRKSEEGFRNFLERMSLLAVMFDVHGHVTFCNERLARRLGCRRDEIVGSNWFESYTQPEQREELSAMLASAVSGGPFPPSNESTVVKCDKKTIIVAWDNMVLRDSKGRITGAASIGRDVTEQRQLQEQYQQAQKLESVGRLAGGVAHDFNNLLTAIIGYNDMVLESLPPASPLRSFAEEVKKSGERAAGLTRQLLAFSRKQVLQADVINLNVAVRDMEKMFRRLIEENIELVTDLDPSAGEVRVDPIQIQQVLMNLVVNARDAMPDGGRITIETRSFKVDHNTISTFELPVGEYAVLIVRDTGHGMDEKTKSRLFEPFFTTKPLGKGTGLGLPTVYGIITQSGGHIQVESEIGRGTTFRMFLPQAMGSVKFTGGKETSLESRGSATILLVEDQAEVRKLASTILAGHGYQVYEAADGTQALQAWQLLDTPVDLLISDVVMPGISGVDLAYRLRAANPSLKIILMSGYSESNLSDRDLLRLDAILLQKPFSTSSFLARIQEALEKSG